MLVHSMYLRQSCVGGKGLFVCMNIHVIFEHAEIKYTHTTNNSHGMNDASTVFPCIIARLLTASSLTWTIASMGKGLTYMARTYMGVSV